ncbi:photosynthetic reaction center cytochrome PufC [Pseudaestuariivita atlantica]|uniref:Photosynthetic reaction center cytochrome c subunit n=1 Tax=Pseudaestuariivita atlantica TaxID=1317121 RepID=A0A0L1JPP6_9RHOB|nr:photosynthetic reaction center cytochrome PufC [Pseudaestuariivita atlantica]KNG93740.1 Photosynthetic reaction center cytochrome C subunit [Pseudaestuariivita atlantica]
MFPKWFNKWNADNPTDVFGPAILIGSLGGAVFVAIMLITWGQPYATASQQSGPRGTGMSQTEFVRALAARKADPEMAAANYVVAPEGEAPAVEYDPGLGDELVTAMRSWTGIPNLFAEDNYQTNVAYLMISMTQFLNEEYGYHVNASGEGVGVTCYTCHRGQPVPNGVWFKLGAVNEAASGWSAVQNRATMQSQSTSLPSNALESYLLGDEVIQVHDLESRVAGSIAEGEVASIQQTEMTFSLMNYYDNSLGVNCVFCHNSRAFYDGGQVTPQWATAQVAREMVQTLNADYLVPLKDTLPDNRLGPIMGDAPKAGCLTCHQGQNRPVNGHLWLEAYPELATIGGG